jgi:serine protease Do
MLDRFIAFLLVSTCGLPLAQAETIQLRDKVSITGPVLAEKSDHVVVDLGFTVLSIPKSHISKISKEQPAKEQATTKPSGKNTPSPTASTAPAEAKTGLFSTATSPLPERSVRELVSRLGEGVVQVKTPGGLGSGFILNEEGYLITNFHVIEGETQITVEVYHQKNGQLDRKSYKQVKIVAMNKFQDLSLLKIEDKDASKFAKVVLGDADAMAVGERVFAIGSPLGLERTVTEGILSTKTRQVQGGLYLQTTAQINPGNSGGPLFNMRGEVIGVTNMKLAFGEGIGFAIPVESVKFFLNHRDAYAYDNDNPNNPYRYLQPPSRIHQALEESKPGKDSE